MNIVFLNGEFLPIEEAAISPLDRGFLFADGIYEVVPVYQGAPFGLEKHLARLARSLAEIRLSMPDYCHIDNLPQRIDELIKKNNGHNLSVYIQITRGCSPTRTHGFPAHTTEPTIFIMCSPMGKPQTDALNATQGEAAITLEDIRWARCDIKSISLLPNQLLRQQALDTGASEAILYKDGYVTEGAASNIFIVLEETLITPPLDNTILSGVTRDLLIALALQNNIRVSERPISLQELANADEIWATSSTKEILPITTLDGKPVGTGNIGPSWRKVAKLYTEAKNSLLFTSKD